MFAWDIGEEGRGRGVSGVIHHKPGTSCSHIIQQNDAAPGSDISFLKGVLPLTGHEMKPNNNCELKHLVELMWSAAFNKNKFQLSPTKPKHSCHSGIRKCVSAEMFRGKEILLTYLNLWRHCKSSAELSLSLSSGPHHWRCHIFCTFSGCFWGCLGPVSLGYHSTL